MTEYFIPPGRICKATTYWNPVAKERRRLSEYHVQDLLEELDALQAQGPSHVVEALKAALDARDIKRQRRAATAMRGEASGFRARALATRNPDLGLFATRYERQADDLDDIIVERRGQPRERSEPEPF